MDASTITSLIASLGFPIVACGAMAFFIVKRSEANDAKLEALRKEQREDLQVIQREHKDEVAKMSEALNNNTIAIEQLTEKIGGLYDHRTAL